MTAKDRRLLACPTDSGTALRAVAETALVVLIGFCSRGYTSKPILRAQVLTPDIPRDDPATSAGQCSGVKGVELRLGDRVGVSIEPNMAQDGLQHPQGPRGAVTP